MILTGVGSRDTVPEVLELMYAYGARFAAKGWILRSGGAEGADSAFERGCDSVNGVKEIYLPWAKFNGRLTTSDTYSPKGYILGSSGQAMMMAQKLLDPAHWGRLSQGGKKLHARNFHQVLGKNLDTPSDLLICWTAGGQLVGGTATAIKLAMQYKIKVLNLFNNKDRQEVLDLLSK